MKIAYILNTYPQPSHSFIRRELSALEGLGHQVTRVAMRRTEVPLVDPQDQAEQDRTQYVLEAGGLALLGAMLRVLIARPAAWWRAFRLAMRLGAASSTGRLRHVIYLAEACHVLALVRREGAAHLHAHFGTNATAVAMLTNALGGPPYSFTVHGPEEFDAPAALSLRTKMDHAAFVVAISSFGRSQLCRWLDHAQWDKIKVVRCGIDPAHYLEAVPMPKEGLTLVSIGRLSEQKGQAMLPGVMAALADELPDLGLRLVGDGDLRGALQAQIAEMGLADRITLTGWLSEAEVRAELARAQALILPSFAEGLPMVVMEAMATGRPVIATSVAGIPELVENGVNGWLVPAGDTDALVRAVRDLAALSQAERARMGQAAFEAVLARHDMHREAAKLAAHFEAVG